MTRRLLLYFMSNMRGINLYPNPCTTKNKQANKKQTSKGPRPKKNPNPTIKSCHSLSICQPHISGWRQWRERNVRKCVWLGTSRFPESVPRAGKPRMAETGSLPCCFPPLMAFPIKCPCSAWPRFPAWCLGRAAPVFYFLLFPHPFIQGVLGHCVEEAPQRPVPKWVWPYSQWHLPNCELTGGDTTWDTANFPHQMEFYWSWRRPTTGLLQQMLCRQTLDVRIPPPLAPPPPAVRDTQSSVVDSELSKLKLLP